MLIGQDGSILLSDFGISMVSQETQSQSMQEIAGTVPYMAPEQIHGRPRPASDQYALGVVVYQRLGGKLPFQGQMAELYSQHLFTQPSSLHIQNPLISSEVEDVIMVALRKDPHQRFASIQAFANALEQAYHIGQIKSA
jgi:serine/threonine protein kinase